MTTLIFLAVVAFLAYRVTTPEMRRDAIKTAATYYVRWRDENARAVASFEEALRTRMSMLIATPAIVAIDVATFVLVRTSAAVSDGPRTTNGEWWRVIAAMCDHDGFFVLVVNMVAVWQLGRILERLVGRFTFLVTFIVAGVFAGLMALWQHPLTPWIGASGAIYGLYSLFAVSFLAGLIHRSDVTIPVEAAKRIGAVALLFAIVNTSTHAALLSSDVVGLLVGVAIAVATARDVSGGYPQTRPVAMALGMSAIVAIAAAVPLRGITDVNPELQRLAAIEDRTRQAYDVVYAKYRKAQADARSVVAVIDDTILPELHAAEERISNLRHVPAEDEPRVAGARRYLQLRAESWTLLAQSLREQTRPAASRAIASDAPGDAAFRTRAQAAHRSVAVIRGKAEAAEREALEALTAVK